MRKDNIICILKEKGFVPFGDNNEYWKSPKYPEIEILDQGVSLRVFDLEGYTITFLSNIKELKLFLDEQK